ncbi:hypothetical protein EJ110_NYTH17710 [Nymphaea thermarum]|nr:hypothetical protein EJ110_NYTH17710 [Nymphaea thermarum]
MAGYSLLLPNSCILSHVGGKSRTPLSFAAPALRLGLVGTPPSHHELRKKASPSLPLGLQAGGYDGVGQEDDNFVEELKVPPEWLVPSKALEESEWLRVALHKWLDDEYCPEAANVEISRCAARSYHDSLMEKQTDLGEILLKMVSDLERISFRESFHGAFSSANAAINLIGERIELARRQ